MPDQRFLYTEEVVGATHPSKDDTINRLALVEHNTDGTHKESAAIDAGTGTGQASMGGVLSVDTTAVGTDADTSEKDLMTYTLPANSLSADGKGVRVTAWGSFAANGNTKTIKSYFGSVLKSASAAYNNLEWRMSFLVFRTGASAQQMHAESTVENADYSFRNAGLTEDETAAIIIKITGQNGTANANDVICQGMLVEFLN